MRDEPLSMIGARRGHFRLESGHHGDLWLEVDALFRRPARLRPAIGSLARRLAAHDVEVVCGPLSGGAFVAQMVALELDAEFCYTERIAVPQAGALYSARYRLPPEFAVNGRRVAVVDDVINAGSAVRATLSALHDAQAVPMAIGALLMLGRNAATLAKDHGLALEAVADLDNTLWPPQNYPLCATGTPLEDLIA
ncbi:orotate phosphoribosyltransferase [Thermomonospora cellulosilytica]|uniref:Orotate phosphoribosyltransferase n=1 Tax=Thermomonospora cellulosilytica TaxID=1411118 RepID=A0A7W3R9H0_9ACTN|nr:phosphoribosyltransferase family protein [Thermomonospora cellulosilytica]MBA9005353.1 orotate phosphoribosyltransferase [Thermomonospora cellulosilytica]